MSLEFTNWLDFLQQWNEEALNILASLQKYNSSFLTELEQEFLQRKTLSQSGATKSQIQFLENRLGTKLPPSYVDFLSTSNGWIQLAMDVDDGLLWSTEEVVWFREQDPEWIEAWDCDPNDTVPDSDYFVYGEKQDCVHLRTKYLRTALAISPCIESAVYLLNPQIVTPEGEWEAWYFGNALPGADRYRSFLEMMIAEKERTLDNLRYSCDYRLFSIY